MPLSTCCSLCIAQCGWVSCCVSHCCLQLRLLLLLHTPSVALAEMKPWDHTHGYQMIQGNMQVQDVTFAAFEGPAACAGYAGSATYALSNVLNAPDAAHPHFFKRVRASQLGGQAQVVSEAVAGVAYAWRLNPVPSLDMGDRGYCCLMLPLSPPPADYQGRGCRAGHVLHVLPRPRLEE